MQDFSQLSSKTVTEVLMLEIKMAPAAKAYLISGYPRSMRDVVEYSEKVFFWFLSKVIEEKKNYKNLFRIDSGNQWCAFDIVAPSCASKTNRLWRQVRTRSLISGKNGIGEFLQKCYARRWLLRSGLYLFSFGLFFFFKFTQATMFQWI